MNLVTRSRRRRHAQPRKRPSSGTTSAVSHKIWECSKCTKLSSENAQEPYSRSRASATRKFEPLQGAFDGN